ncbi:Protein CBG14879 [Caenorhabditis briggsae]|uniref:Protein CBG14879 n=1 Tax=Caenorhabditis briggsae TaxID=6238 RepID=A8XKW5_CAEBR|nr:Protein CBG14879 [Caenorhabditis briggsae]CAP33289.1 Protein CBG14879 [Caenorhabditis briggsae]
MEANFMIRKKRENHYLVSNVQVAGSCRSFQVSVRFNNFQNFEDNFQGCFQNWNRMRGAAWFPGCTNCKDSFQNRIGRNEDVRSNRMRGSETGMGKNQDSRVRTIAFAGFSLSKKKELIGLRDAPTSNTSRTTIRPASRICTDLKQHDDRSTGRSRIICKISEKQLDKGYRVDVVIFLARFSSSMVFGISFCFGFRSVFVILVSVVVLQFGL